MKKIIFSAALATMVLGLSACEQFPFTSDNATEVPSDEASAGVATETVATETVADEAVVEG